MSIKMSNVTLIFKNKVVAVDHVNLEIGQGIYGLLGENGAGKTTLMRVLTTILKPIEGTVALDGILYTERNYEKIQRKIGYLPQEIDLYPNLTIRECLQYMGELSNVEKNLCKKRIDEYLEKTSLKRHEKKKIRHLSGGMKRRVGLIQALLNEPDFLVIDEPTTGLDPEERVRIRNLLVEFSENRTVLLSTHVVEDLAATCKELSIMKQGRFLYSGSVRELLKKAQDHIFLYKAGDELEAKELEKKYHVISKQYMEQGLQIKILADKKPEIDCIPAIVTLEDAYIYSYPQLTLPTTP